MESQAERAAAEKVAREVRAELARQKRTAAQLAAVIGVTAHTAGRRLSGATPFNVVELGAIAEWLGVEPYRLLGEDAPAARVAS